MEDLALLPKTIFDERFEILGLAGSGGMGSVYRARHIKFDKLVAIKLLRRDLSGDVEATRRFRREAQTARDLNQKNIAAVRFFGINDGQPYIVFDYLEGETLQTILDRDGKLPYGRFLKLFVQVCAGLGHAHKHGVIHRDIKPSNILCMAADEVKILDFGIAKIIEPENSEAQRLTGTGTLLGTPFYMSPEQGRGEQVAGQSDIYALGCLMYHCCFGQPPFTGESAYQILYNHTYEKPALDTVPPGYPRGILVVLSKCLAKDALERYASMDELSEELQGADSLKIEPVPAAKMPKFRVPALPGVVPALWKWVRIGGLAVVVVALVTGGILLWRAGSEQSAPPEVIKAEWSIKHDPVILRERFEQLAQTHPDQARQLLQDLRDDLLLNPCYETAAMFLDEVDLAEEGRHDDAQRPKLDDCVFILRELPAKAWQRADANPLELVRRWSDDRASHFTKNSDAMMGLYLGLAMGLDGNRTSAALVNGFGLSRLSRDQDFSAHDTGVANVIAERLWKEDGAVQAAVRLLELANSGTDELVQVPNLIKRAQIHDSVRDNARAVWLWQRAVESAKSDPDVTVADRARAWQGLADDEMLAGHLDAALAHYQQVLPEVMKLPPGSYRWSSLARLGNSYALIKEDAQANKAFAQGLADCQGAYALPDNEDTHLMRLKALLSMAQFLSRLGRPAEAWPLYAQVQQSRAALKADGKAALDEGLLSLEPLPDQMKCRQKVSTPAATSKMVAAETEFRRNMLAAEWCQMRGDLLGCAQYHETAARYCRQIIGSEAHGNMVVAAIMRYRLEDGWPEVIQDATEALQGSQSRVEQNVLDVILGHAWLMEGRRDAARGYLKAGVEPLTAIKDPLSVQGWLDLGTIDLEAGQPAVAKIHFTRGYEEGAKEGMKTNKNFRRLAFALIKLLRETGEDSGAIALIDRFKKDAAPVK